MSSKRLSHHQACWSEFLSRFNFKISYHPGSQCKANTLTRRSQDLPSGSDPCQDYMEQVVLKPKNIASSEIQIKPIRILKCSEVIQLMLRLKFNLSQTSSKQLTTPLMKMILWPQSHKCYEMVYSTVKKCLSQTAPWKMTTSSTRTGYGSLRTMSYIYACFKKPMTKQWLATLGLPRPMTSCLVGTIGQRW